MRVCSFVLFFFQAEDGIRDLVRSRGLGDVYKRQGQSPASAGVAEQAQSVRRVRRDPRRRLRRPDGTHLSLIHI